MPACRSLPATTTFTYTAKELAARWMFSARFVRKHAANGNIKGADNTMGEWRFTADAAFVRPISSPTPDLDDLLTRMRAAEARRARRASVPR
jgi:hypothetical protein